MGTRDNAPSSDYRPSDLGGHMIKEHASVVLLESRPDSGLEVGDVGVVVHVHRGGEAYEVEFLTLEGETVGIETLSADQIRAASRRDMPHVRDLLAA